MILGGDAALTDWVTGIIVMTRRQISEMTKTRLIMNRMHRLQLNVTRQPLTLLLVQDRASAPLKRFRGGMDVLRDNAERFEAERSIPC